MRIIDADALKADDEVTMKVYLVNVETYYMGYGTTRCLGGIFDSLEKAEKYIADIKEKIDPKFDEELECYIDEVNLNHGHSLNFLGWDKIGQHLEMKINFEDAPIILGGYEE